MLLSNYVILQKQSSVTVCICVIIAYMLTESLQGKGLVFLLVFFLKKLLYA